MEDGVSTEAGQPGTEDKRSLFVTCEERDSIIFAKLVGPSVGQREAPIIATQILAECEKPAGSVRALVLDFKNVAFMNSTGLGMCVEIRHAVQKRGGKVILYRVNEQIAAVLKMTRMDRLYTIVNNPAKLEQALKS